MGEISSFTTVVQVPEEIVAEARHRKAASNSDADLGEFIVDHLQLELDY